MKLNKYKFLKLWKARTSKRRKFGNFRTSLTYVRFFYGLTQWAFIAKLRAQYKNYIWLISKKNFRLPFFERYSYLHYNNIYIHPLQTQTFYRLTTPFYGRSSPLIEHRRLRAKAVKNPSSNALNIYKIFYLLVEATLQFVTLYYKILIPALFYLLND